MRSAVLVDPLRKVIPMSESFISSNVVSRLRGERVCNTLGHKMLMHEAADEIERLERERDELKHDIERHVAITASQATENERLRAALERIAAWPDGGNEYGQRAIKHFAREALDGEPAAPEPAPEPAPYQMTASEESSFTKVFSRSPRRLPVETSGGWRPIETVPRDVKVLTLRWSMGDKRPLIDTATLERHGQATGLHHGNGVFFCKVTHWMPLPEPPLKANDPPAESPAPTLTFIVNGTETPFEVDLGKPLLTFVTAVLDVTGNTGRPPEHWEIRNMRGSLLDSRYSAQQLGLTAGARVFLSPQVGFGGASENG